MQRTFLMIELNPVPTIPALEADNAIDLVKLGHSALQTYICYPGIETGEGDLINLNWRGCAHDGAVVDELIAPIEVKVVDLTPEGVLAQIENKTLTDLDQGWVFYSYSVKKAAEPDYGDESRRLFFYVGKRPRISADLPVLQIKESHDLHYDLNTGSRAQPTVMLVPYQAMAAGDVVTLHCRRFNADGRELLPPIAKDTSVKAVHVGKPLALPLTRSDLLRVDGGRVEISYGIQYADTSLEKTVSASQTLQLLPPPTALLPALTIVGHGGGPINPVHFPEGLPVRIEGYPGMSVGDDVLCHVHSDASAVEPLVLPIRVDASTLDKGFIDSRIDPQWLLANNGQVISLQYQFAWIGSAGSSLEHAVTIREPLELEMPIVVGARPGQEPVEGEGELEVLNLSVTGVDVRIDSRYGANDKVEVFWAGYGTTGYARVDTPTAPDSKTFNIAPQFIPANLGKTVQVYYCVTPAGESVAIKSPVYGLRVLAIALDYYLSIQSRQAQQTNGRILLSKIPAEGELFSLRAWVYMREGHTVNAMMTGKDINNQPLTLPLFNDYRVTAADVANKQVSTHTSAAILRQFQTGPVTVQVSVIYEPGAETNYREARFTLEA